MKEKMIVIIINIYIILTVLIYSIKYVYNLIIILGYIYLLIMQKYIFIIS